MPARELHRHAISAKAASAMSVGQVVGYDVADTSFQVVPLATINVEPLGIALASVSNPGDAVTIIDRGNVIKVQAAASLGAGADIGVVGATTSLGLAAAASGVAKWAVGKSLSAAAAGETFSLHVNPKQLGGLA